MPSRYSDLQISRKSVIIDSSIGDRFTFTRRKMNATNLIECDPEKLSGTPVFFGTRVPIKNLFDCLEAGESLEEFLDQFPTVTREQALNVLELSRERLLTEYESAA